MYDSLHTTETIMIVFAGKLLYFWEAEAGRFLGQRRRPSAHSHHSAPQHGRPSHWQGGKERKWCWQNLQQRCQILCFTKEIYFSANLFIYPASPFSIISVLKQFKMFYNTASLKIKRNGSVIGEILSTPSFLYLISSRGVPFILNK